MRFLFAFSIAVSLVATSFAQEQKKPNIVWIIVDDMSADFLCYLERSPIPIRSRSAWHVDDGKFVSKTPHVDQLAKDGILFKNAVTTAPVCSACRSALITGMYQTSIGAQNHRSGHGEMKINLPDGVELVPRLFKDAGYHVSNVNVDDFTRSGEQVAKNSKVKVAKTDYNFVWDQKVYEKTHWTTRDDKQPFFAQIQLHGGKHRGKGDGEVWPAKAKEVLGENVDPSLIQLPPYLADHPIIRKDWAQYLDCVRYTDWEVGRIVDRLKQSGDHHETVIFFMTDHGISHIRHKQFLYEGGIHIPIIVAGPGIKAGQIREDVVEQIDLAATSLALAGIEKPAKMQSRNILASDYQPRTYVFSARDRCDETIDHIRSVRSKEFKYIRNFLPNRPWLQPNAYQDGKPILQATRQLHRQGLLNERQREFFAPTRPPEELYRIADDLDEMRNLVNDPKYSQHLDEMRKALDDWMVETDDHGRIPESWEQYDSDMAEYTGPNAKPDGAIMKNIQLMKQWAAEGK